VARNLFILIFCASITVLLGLGYFHEGINALFHYAFFGNLPSISDWSSFFVTLLALTSVILLAALSWRLMERPLISRARALHRY
jgi:peptidoglycan/LPS O-acetylase OafA/YrhL